MGTEQRPSTSVTDLEQRSGELNFIVSGWLGEHRVRFWGDIPEHPAGPPSEPALAVALLPAMSVGGKLSLPGPLSPELRRASPDLQAVLSRIATDSKVTDRELRPVDVTAPASTGLPKAEDHPARGVGAFFSGGVDSWQTLLANPDITDLIYVHGFDIPIDQPQVSTAIEARMTEAARRRGKRLRVVRTDLRILLDQSITWEIAHGPALAAVALLLAPACGRVLIPATNTYAEPGTRGSHPLLDHLWSTELCRIDHCGAYLTRVQKIEQVAEYRDALDVLRVCWRHVDRYNCGECEKCLRTMVALEAIGALERCPTFPVALDLDAVADLHFIDPELPIWWRENLELARGRGAPGELVAAIECCLTNAEDRVGSDANAEEQLRAVVESRSWRLTAPLRRLGSGARRVRSRRADRR